MVEQCLYRLIVSFAAALMLWFSPRTLNASLLAGGFVVGALATALYVRYSGFKRLEFLARKVYGRSNGNSTLGLSFARIQTSLLIELLLLMALVALVRNVFFLMIAAGAFSSWIFWLRRQGPVQIFPALRLTADGHEHKAVASQIKGVEKLEWTTSQWYWLLSVLLAVGLSFVLLRYPYRYSIWLQAAMSLILGVHALWTIPRLLNAFPGHISFRKIFRSKRLR